MHRTLRMSYVFSTATNTPCGGLTADLRTKRLCITLRTTTTAAGEERRAHALTRDTLRMSARRTTLSRHPIGISGGQGRSPHDLDAQMVWLAIVT